MSLVQVMWAYVSSQRSTNVFCGTVRILLNTPVHTAQFQQTIKADRPLTRDTLNAPCLLTNRQFQWTGNGHLQLPLAELSRPSPNVHRSAPLVQTEERNWQRPLTYDLDLQSQASQGQGRPSYQKSMSKVKRFKEESAHRQTDGHTHTPHKRQFVRSVTHGK